MKVWNYFYIGITMLVLFDLFGVLGGSGVLGLIGFERVGDDIQFNFSALTATFLAVLVGAVGSSIAISYFTKSPAENYILVPIITGVLAGVVASFVAIWTAAVSYPIYIKAILSVILVPFIAGYLLALLEWFRGTD